MKLPRTARIGGHIWHVRVVSPEHPELQDEEEHVLAATVPEKSTIYISRNLGPDARVFYFVHECLHAIFDRSGATHELGRKCKSGPAHDRFEERIVRALTPGVLDLFALLKGLT